MTSAATWSRSSKPGEPWSIPEGVAWNDGRRVAADVILWATGFRAALGHLAPLRLREQGGVIRLEGTRVVKDPRIHLIGYGESASTIGANRAGRAAAWEITELLGIRRDRRAASRRRLAG